MNIADKTVLNILAKSSEAFLLLISSVVMVRHLSKSDYGTFLQVMLIGNTTVMLTSLGLPHSIYYFFQIVPSRSRFIIRNVIFSLSAGLIASLIMYAFKGILSDLMNNPLLSEYGWITALFIFFRSPSALREPILISYDNLILNSAATVLCNIVVFVPVIIGVFFSQPLKILLIIFVISAGCEWLIFLYLIFKTSFNSKIINLSQAVSADQGKMVSFKEQLLYALPIAVSSYIGIIGRQLDQYIVSAFFTPRDFAVYSRGATQIPILSSIHFTINNIMMPKYISSYQSGDIQTFLRYFHICTEKVAKINFPVFSFLFAVAPSIVTLLYTKEYIESSSILRVYLFFLILGISVYSIIPRASGKTSFIMYVTVISVVSNFILSLILVLMIGTIGAAIATIISMVIGIFCYLFHDCKVIRVSFDKIFPWNYLFKLILISSAAAIPVYSLEYFYHPEGLNLFILLTLESIIYFYCYLFLMMRYSMIFQDDIELLNKWLNFDVKSLLCKLAFLKESRIYEKMQ